MDSYAGFAVLESFHAHDLRDVLAVHRVVQRGVRGGDKDAHARIKGLEMAGEINAAF
jgi:hypothetical protein